MTVLQAVLHNPQGITIAALRQRMQQAGKERTANEIAGHLGYLAGRGLVTRVRGNDGITRFYPAEVIAQ